MGDFDIGQEIMAWDNASHGCVGRRVSTEEFRACKWRHGP